MDILDFRSDTVTKPTPAMREAMAMAQVGDDVYGEDPTVNRLQEIAADLMGMEAGLFVPSGTMGNLAAILAHCTRGDEVILGDKAHTFLLEGGGLAALGGVSVYPLRNRSDGTMDLKEVQNAIREDDAHFPISRLVTIENTHNRCGGVAITVEYTNSIAQLAKEFHLKFHIDGARIFNAAADLGVTARELASSADSISFCLSKALSAPVGSVLCGSKDFIYRAHRVRKKLGGGMRQAGVLAAAGIVALEQMIDRLGDDHRRARDLALGLSHIPGIVIDPQTQHSNMVFFELAEGMAIDVGDFLAGLRKQNLLVGRAGGKRIRMVTHYWIEDSAIDQAINIIKEFLNKRS